VAADLLSGWLALSAAFDCRSSSRNSSCSICRASFSGDFSPIEAWQFCSVERSGSETSGTACKVSAWASEPGIVHVRFFGRRRLRLPDQNTSTFVASSVQVRRSSKVRRLMPATSDASSIPRASKQVRQAPIATPCAAKSRNIS